MPAVIAATGQTSEKIVDGRWQEVTPFVGADREGEFSSFGIGFITGYSAQIWGLVLPHMLIKSWRAMKILEQIPGIYFGTLCACWYAAGDEIHSSDAERVDELAHQFPSRDEFEMVRAAALAAVPTAEELDTMLRILREKQVSIDSFELTKLIEQGKLAPSPIIDEIVREEEAARRAYQAGAKKRRFRWPLFSRSA